jgi:hypothetical protein
METNVEQGRRLNAGEQSGLPASKEAMTDVPPPTPNRNGIGTVPATAQDDARMTLKDDAMPSWPPPYLRR